MMDGKRLASSLAKCDRVQLASLPTPLERGPELPGGARLYVKRDDLTGLGMGGSKARKLEFLCGEARKRGVDLLITVGAEQSNHVRMTAAAGAVLGIETHVVLGGAPTPSGNQLLAQLFGAKLHFPGTDDWKKLEAAMDELATDFARSGRRPYRMPIGGSTPIGACGFALAWLELSRQAEELGLKVSTLVHASSSGGTHAGLLAARAVCHDQAFSPDILAVGVAKTSADLTHEARRISKGCLHHLGFDDVEVGEDEIEVDGRWRGPDYALPTTEGDRAIRWGARRGAWVFDRTYTGKAFSGLLAAAEEQRFRKGDAVVFWHSGGQPAVFAPDGAPVLENADRSRLQTDAASR